MSKTIKIKIDGTRYRIPTEDDVRKAKDFILQRNEVARTLVSRVDELLDDMIERIVTICYRYNVDPHTFTISSSYNEDMMQEIAEVMDEVEAMILSAINDYSTRVTDDPTRTATLLAWIAILGRGNKNLQDTLDGYLYKTMKDVEAAVAALRAKDVIMAEAVNTIKVYKHSVYSMPAITEAFAHSEDFEAEYIRKLGVQEGAVGLSNSGATNVTNMAKTTAHMAWMRSLGMDFDENGAVAYFVGRGSDYPCQKCDDSCGLWPINDKSNLPPRHPGCCCWAMPIYARDM